jgi:hypothetical protein
VEVTGSLFPRRLAVILAPVAAGHLLPGSWTVFALVIYWNEDATSGSHKA